MSFINKIPQIIYCERGDFQTLWAEPINALTNLAYFLVAFLAYKLLKNKKIKDKQLLVLPWMLSIVALGSFIYHTERNSVTLFFDAIPIVVFILYTLFLTLKELFQSKLKTFIIFSGFVVFEVMLSIYVPREFMNGSIRHIAAIIFVSLIGWVAFNKFGNKVLKPLIGVVGLYGLAILFRSIDMLVCPFFPTGTHFLWHTLAAFAGYQAIVLLSVLKPQHKPV